MTNYKKGVLLAEGKTKRIWEVIGNKSLVVVTNKSDITAFDNPEFTKQFDAKARYATKTTCRVFELLERAGIPVAYVKQTSPTEFVAQKCSMIPLEAVARRYGVGSFLKRNPNFKRPKGEPPVRFHKLVVEFFLKTTKGKLQINDSVIVQDLNPEKGEEDPFIANPYNTLWDLVHSKKPVWDPTAKLYDGISASQVLRRQEVKMVMQNLADHLRDTFLVLEGVWTALGHRLIDLKIEFGAVGDKIFVADVIDNDSWGLRDQSWKELSKEAFRQGEALDKVEQKYGIVADLTNNFRIPLQCLVLWVGSDKDEFPEWPQETDLGIAVEKIIASGHKSPQKCLNTLENLLRKYPDGGVIVTKVGMSNGLGPMLAARTSWPVISIPATLSETPEDVWSSPRMPSNVPMAVICSEGNAINSALKILAQKNPLLYKQLQKKIEELDG